jgi:hypothetical protein
MYASKLTCAFIRDGALVVNFGSAMQPFVWRYDLSKVHVVAFRVVHNAPHWELGVEGSKGEFTPVATFTREAAAQKALRYILKALKQQGREKRVLSTSLTVLGILLLIILLGALLIAFIRASSVGAMSAVNQGAVQTVESGKVLSADDALSMPTNP